MSYDKLSPKEKEVLDYMMFSHLQENRLILSLSKALNTSRRTMQNRLKIIYIKYDIDTTYWAPRCRLVYLRGRELGMIDALEDK